MASHRQNVDIATAQRSTKFISSQRTLSTVASSERFSDLWDLSHREEGFDETGNASPCVVDDDVTDSAGPNSSTTYSTVNQLTSIRRRQSTQSSSLPASSTTNVVVEKGPTTAMQEAVTLLRSSQRNRGWTKLHNGSRSYVPRPIVRPMRELLTEISMEVMETKRNARASSCRRKLARTILNLRAVAALLEDVHRTQCRKYRYRNNTHCMGKRSLRELVGDYGVALFAPLSEEALQPRLLPRMSTGEAEMLKLKRSSSLGQAHDKVALKGRDDMEERSRSCRGHDDCDDYFFKYEIHPLQVEPEDASCLRYAPHLLSDSMFQELSDDALPRNLRMYKWKRIFNIALDGDAFITMLDKCAPYKHTLIVIRTTTGYTLGGFASEKWRDQDGYDKRHSYFGTGICFLFSDYPIPTTPSKQLTTYKWSGVNDYCQICDVDRRKIAMGGGEGEFGLIVEDSFLRGYSGSCATFSNPPLIPGIDGTFDILGFEVYGLLPLIPTVTKSNVSRSPKSCFSLLNND